MEHGRVRAILGRHALGADRPAAAGDPTMLVPASVLRRALDGRSDAEQRSLALDYVHLWARTFRTLARHLRGRPERALALFAEEVYPFLRGDRRAARLERTRAGEARILLPADLPDGYHAGLLEGFAALSGAAAHATAYGNGVFAVHYRLQGGLRLARASQVAADLRAPLLLAALLAALAGLALARLDAGAAELAGATGAAADAMLWTAVLAGTLAAQAAANLLHLARRQGRHPFGPVRLSPAVALAASAGLYAVAAASGLWLALAAGRPLVLAFAAAGLAIGLAYGRFRAQGLGPVLAAATYGLLIPAGAAYAAGSALPGDPLGALMLAAFALPLGLLCAAMLFLDNLADRPLDEAGGQRTLAVRLPQRHQALVLGAFAGGAAALLMAFSFPAFSPLHLAAGMAVALGGLALSLAAHRHVDDPHALAPARLGAGLLMACVGLFQAGWAWGAAVGA